MDDGADIFLRVSRGRALCRGILLGAPAAILAATSAAVYLNLSAEPGTVPRGLVDASIWILALPLPLLALLLGIGALRWLLLAAWPGRIGFLVGVDRLAAHLGPFGSELFSTDELDIRYPFESSDGDDDRSFEALLPQEQQLAVFLPRITHPRSRIPLDRRILKFTGLDEEEAASRMAQTIERWRKPTKDQDT